MQALTERQKKRRAARAANRVMDALEQGSSPSVDDLVRGGLCVDCWGFGYVEDEDDHDIHYNCTRCGGDGLAKTNK